MAFFGKLIAILIIGAIIIATGLLKYFLIGGLLFFLFWIIKKIVEAFRGDKDDGRR